VGTSLLQFSEDSDALYTTSISRYVHVRTINLTNQTTSRMRFPMLNEVPNARRDASLDDWQRLESPST
jgi:hypothetical protein